MYPARNSFHMAHAFLQEQISSESVPCRSVGWAADSSVTLVPTNLIHFNSGFRLNHVYRGLYYKIFWEFQEFNGGIRVFTRISLNKHRAFEHFSVETRIRRIPSDALDLKSTQQIHNQQQSSRPRSITAS